MKSHLLIILLCLGHLPQSRAQSPDELVRKGNNLYRADRLEEALDNYRKAALADPAHFRAVYNQAVTLYKLNKLPDALLLLEGAPSLTSDKILRGQAEYNRGVLLGKEKKLPESVEAYKAALRQNPDDSLARENLQKALLELRKKNPPPPPKPNKQQKKKQEQQQSAPLSRKDVQQQLQLLQQKEKETRMRMQQQKSQGAGSQPKDW